MKITLHDDTPAGRIGRELLAVRALLSAARERGDLGEVDRLEQRERAITSDLLSAVTLPPLAFSVFGVNSIAGTVPGPANGGQR